MPSAQYGLSLSVGGVAIQKTIVRQADSAVSAEITLPAGKAGTLTTRTDDNTGEATLGTGHGIESADVVDVYWDGGMRYGMTVGTVDGNDVPLDGGTGDNLPAQGTAVVVTKQVPINVAIDGDAAEIIGLSLEMSDPSATSKGHVLFEDSDGDDIAAIPLSANQPLVYDLAGGASNPFTGDPIVSAAASNGSSSASATLKILAAVDATP